MESYFDLFVSEGEEFIKLLNNELLNLEADPTRLPSILEIFRVFHSIKGMAQTMGFEEIAAVSHRIEDLLNEAKENRAVEPGFVNLLFGVADFLTASLAAIKNKGPTVSATGILNAIEKLKRGEDIKLPEGRVGAKEIPEIRVKMAKLDKLFNLTNELIIAKSRFLKLGEEIGHPAIVTVAETASRLITALQDEVMRLRMLPLATVFDFFPRWFRDEAKRQNKEIEFDIVGGEVEVDRSIIDVLKEPLMHLLRNSLDHGIEKKGKISLTAVRERERIRIAVSDNGRGIDIEEIRRIALEKNIITPAEAAHLTKDDFLRILMNPHFSTKKQVSEISGRGIGLDVVNTTITRLGGRLEIASEKGKGSIFTVDLPLSLALIRAMIFRLNGLRFALPLTYVQETFYLEKPAVKTVFHRELFPLRDEILPLVRLEERLNYPESNSRKSVIVVQYHNIRRGYVVDEVIGEDEIVVKKLDPLLPASFYSGCSIYADGLPILIIDPRGFE